MTRFVGRCGLVNLLGGYFWGDFQKNTFGKGSNYFSREDFRGISGKSMWDFSSMRFGGIAGEKYVGLLKH